MKHIILFILLAFICSCVIEPAKDVEYVNNNQTYLLLANSVIQAWKSDITLPQVTSTCKTTELGVRFYNDSMFKEQSFYCAIGVVNGQMHCDTDSVSCPYGCASGFFKPMPVHPIRRGNVYVIGLADNIKLLANSEEIIEYTIRHEIIHWLSHCTGHESTQITSEDGGYYFPYSYSDSQHKDPRLWSGSNSVLDRSFVLFQAANTY